MKLFPLTVIISAFYFFSFGESLFPLLSQNISFETVLKDSFINSCALPNSDSCFFKPGEAINVKITPDSTSFLNGIYKIDNDGYIDFPVIGNFFVGNLTKIQFIERIKSSCLDYIHYPYIEVQPLIRVSLLGGFFKPGLYWVDSRNSLWDVIRLGGGLKYDNSLQKIRWERDGQIVSKNIITQFQSGQSLKSIGFKSGDQLCVPDKAPHTFTFREDFFPVFTLILSTITTGITVYQTYRLSKD
ncbi:MAG: hypothetical protein GX640_05445 [Fibrobacter sp.]|nr:hypothetical protein [Fibrobacter sp.]